MTAPLTPPDCDLSDFPRMMLDIRRLRGSSFDATFNDSAWRAGLNLWMSAWHRVPAASLEDNEAELTKAAGLGRDVKTWRKLKAEALRGWVKCSDGLLYHETIAELALEAWIDKLGQRLSSGAGNAARHKIEFDPAPVYDDVKTAAGMLRALNPKSRHLSKSHVLRAAAGIPPGDKKPPTGKPGRVSPRSQGNGMEGKVGEASKKASPTNRVSDDERAVGSSPPRVWQGPCDVREAFAKAMGEDWTRAYIDPAGWQDVPERALIPATGTAGRKILSEARAVLRAEGLSLLEKAA